MRTSQIAAILFFLLVFFQASTLKAIIIPVETENLAVVLETDKTNNLFQVYFGKKLTTTNEYEQIYKQIRQKDPNNINFHGAYTSSGTWNLVEPALTIKHADGNLSTELLYVSHESKKVNDNVNITSILLQDPVYKTEVRLLYKTYIKQDIIEQWAEITNKEKGTIILEKYASANLNFFDTSFYLTHYYGIWGMEMQPEHIKLTSGIKTIDSKLGARTNLYNHQVFMLSLDKPANEKEGKVLLGTLAWTGNFKFEFEVDAYRNLRLISGINPHASAYPLSKDKTFKTPSFIYAYSEQGTGNASRNLHHWAKNYRIKNGNGNRLTLLNNWETTHFNFNEEVLTGMFDDSKKIGVDMFLLDDGWFGNDFPRNGPSAGLGDWKVNQKKLPNGIPFLMREAERSGIKFGLWVEPEMINPKSDLYRKHPDWVIKQPERPEKHFRNQLVLDLANPAVQNYIYDVIDEILVENPTLRYLKWDCNAVIYNAHSAYLEKSKQHQSQLYVDYVHGFYNILKRIEQKYPELEMMLCSGGGGRSDYESLQYFTEFWPSDNTDPLERVFIQWNYSYFFPAIATCNHITNFSSVDIKYKTDVAMMGKMGYDIAVNKMTEKELQFTQEAIKTYNSFKGIILHGKQYRLKSPYENPYASLIYVDEAKNKAIAFCYLIENRFSKVYSPTPMALDGLDPLKMYEVKEINLMDGVRSAIHTAVYSGEFLMQIGINPIITKTRSSVVLEINALN